MSASIPIPGARHTSRNFDDDIDDDDATQSASSPLLYEYQDADLGISLPTARHMPHARHFHSQPPQDGPSPTTDDPFSSRDDIATSWPPRPSVRLVSRSARRWANHHKSSDTGRTSSRRTTTFEPWDFSEVASATDQAQSAFLRGSARAERPPREGVSGTYFIRRIESKSSVLGVFKPVDEEAGEIELSPSIQPSSVRSPGYGDAPFSLGPPHGSSASPTDSSTSPSPRSRREFYSYSDRCKGNTPGFSAGEGALKEVAAYLLDHDHFARVPQTALATCMFESDLPEKNKTVATNGNGNGNSEPPVGSQSSSAASASYYVDPLYLANENTDTERMSNMRTKTGAFQVYVSNVGDADDFGPGVFDKDQVHQVAILDIRTLNHDRHSGNLLVKPSENATAVRGTKFSRYDIVPIDHGYILPAVVKSVPWPIWMDWSMTREALSPEVKDYVARLDATSEARILNDELEGKIREGSLRTLKIATALLQKGVAAGLTIYEIGLLIYSPRQCPEARSELQKIVEEAEDAGYARKSHIAQETFSGNDMNGHSEGLPYSNGNNFMEQPKLGKGGLPYRSMGYLPSLGNTCSDNSENFIDDYIVKYATKKIGELVRTVADRKKTRPIAPPKGSGESPFRTLGRTRSIPNFGIGIRPVNAMFNSINMANIGTSEAPTPACSPVASARCSRSNSRRTPTEQLEAEMNAHEDNGQPFHFSIDSGMTILPTVGNIGMTGMPTDNTKPPAPIPPSMPSGNTTVTVKSRNIPTGKKIRHRRNASERNALEKVGSFEDLPPPSLPLLNIHGVDNNDGDTDGNANGKISGARFDVSKNKKSQKSEKSSPVCPLDSTSLWTDDNSD